MLRNENFVSLVSRIWCCMSKLSVVVPVYCDEESLPCTIPTLLDLQNTLSPHELELVFVDDGSLDRSYEMLLEWQQKYPQKIIVVKLT